MVLRWLGKALGLAGAGAAVVIGVGLYIAHLEAAAFKRGERAERLEWQEAQAQPEKQEREQGQANQAETARRYAEQQEAINAAQIELDAARRDAAAASAAGERLRAQIASLTASCRATGNPSAAVSGPATDAAGTMLADVQRRLGEATNAIARYADEARTAGLVCERSYDALSHVPAGHRGPTSGSQEEPERAWDQQGGGR